MGPRPMKIAELLDLPVSVTLDTSNRAFGIGRTTGFSLAKRGEYPVPVLRLGHAYRVRRADLLRALGVEQSTATPAAGNDDAAGSSHPTAPIENASLASSN